MKLLSGPARFFVAGAIALAPVVTVAAPALACGNSYRYEVDPKTNLIVKAEEALNEGDYKQAWKLATDATGAVGKTVEGKDAPASLSALRAPVSPTCAYTPSATRWNSTVSAWAKFDIRTRDRPSQRAGCSRDRGIMGLKAPR